MYASKGKEDEQAKEASPEEEILADKKRLAKWTQICVSEANYQNPNQKLNIMTIHGFIVL